ncbi:hypothetical protein EDD11_001243 [Mortierella claussenii]|nr:hypothetical protein EDD11_001243 [Mortierella claussenii]
MSAVNVNVNPKTPWAKYYCNENTSCPLDGYTCHFNKYCIPTLAEGVACFDEKDPVAPFIARVDNVYTYFCDMPNEFKPQTTKCPLGCENWEDCHSDVCFVKKCTKAQAACKAGDFNMCMGITREETFCHDAVALSGSHGVQLEQEKTGLSGSQIGGIAGGVSVAVVALMTVGAFFLVRRRRAAKASKAQASTSNQSLPTYSAQDEKNAMKQVTTQV